MENWRSVVRVSAMTQIFLSKIIIRNFNFYLRIGCKSFVYVLSSGGGPGIVLTTHSGRPAHVYLSSVLVHSLLLPLKTFDPWAFECVISTMWWPPSETRTHTQSQDKNENFWPDRKSNPDRWVGRQGFYWARHSGLNIIPILKLYCMFAVLNYFKIIKYLHRPDHSFISWLTHLTAIQEGPGSIPGNTPEISLDV